MYLLVARVKEISLEYKKEKLKNNLDEIKTIKEGH
jgi:hypothetical protein